MTAALAIFMCSACCHGQRSFVGVDILSGVCMKTIHFDIAHKITERWSAGGDIGINTKAARMDQKSIESEHLENITSSTVKSSGFRDSFQEFCIHIDYWPQRTYEGTHISIGGCIKDRKGPDLTLGLGYFIHIWKGIGVELTYRCGIMETFHEGKLPAKGIKASICYVF